MHLIESSCATCLFIRPVATRVTCRSTGHVVLGLCPCGVRAALGGPASFAICWLVARCFGYPKLVFGINPYGPRLSNANETSCSTATHEAFSGSPTSQ
jgi:hypothetical protein